MNPFFERFMPWIFVLRVSGLDFKWILEAFGQLLGGVWKLLGLLFVYFAGILDNVTRKKCFSGLVSPNSWKKLKQTRNKFEKMPCSISFTLSFLRICCLCSENTAAERRPLDTGATLSKLPSYHWTVATSIETTKYLPIILPQMRL